MRPANRMASLALLTFAASLLQVDPAGAGAIASYSIVDLGFPINYPDRAYPLIDESGNLTNFPAQNTGVYSSGSVSNPAESGNILYEYVHGAGSDANLLPPVLQNPANAGIDGLNSSGIVIGHLSGQPYIYSVAAGQFIDVQWLPGQTQPPVLVAINNLGQMVGQDGNKFLYYSSPASVPISLSDLLPANSGWKLFTVTDINDLGEIAGVGDNPAGQETDYKLVPTTAPEPTTLAILSLGSVLYAGWMVRTRALRPQA